MTWYSHGYCSYGPGQAQLQICVFQISLSHHVMHSAGLTVWPPRAQLDQYLTISWSLLVELFYWNAIIFDAMTILHHAGFHRVHAFFPVSDFSYDSLTIFTVWPLFDHFPIGVIPGIRVPCSDPLTTLCCIVWPCFDCCLTFFGTHFLTIFDHSDLFDCFDQYGPESPKSPNCGQLYNQYWNILGIVKGV